MKRLLFVLLLASPALVSQHASAQSMKLNDLGYFEARGTNVLVYNNIYNGGFYDEKFAGLEIIQRGERLATGGGIRLMNTPEQWDIFGVVSPRRIDRKESSVEVDLNYEDYGFVPRFKVLPKDRGVVIQIWLDKPVPQELVGKAGMNLEFFPASYFGHNYLVDNLARILPKHPMHNTEVHPVSEKIPQYFGESTFDDRGRGDFLVPLPLSTGHRIVMAPENEALRVSVTSDEEISIFDGRHLAQNGMFVLRSLLPGGKTGKVLEWYLEPSISNSWIRKPNIGFSQVGYTPAQKKVAVVEMDKNDSPESVGRLLKVNPDGSKDVVKRMTARMWGEYHHRYNYVQLDFSDVREPGLYCIEYQGVETNAFPIDKDVYSDKWHPSMDISLVVNMDHMEVNEAYRIWHGRANMDDALQAPANVRLHDGYYQGDVTNTKYQPLEHIPGLAIGGWYDAGDFDIQANSVLNTTQDLSYIWREFKPLRDQTLIDEVTQYADIHVPDGVPDNVQLIMHGTLNINAQVENIGFVAQVIGQPDMHHYHHLGDAMTLTDGKIYDPSLARYEVKGDRSGTPDDRYVFTSRFSPAGTMQDIVSLAAAYPALKDYYPEEAERSLRNAIMLWDKYHEAAAPNPNAQQQENRRWGGGGDTRINAAIELWMATGEQKYKDFFLPLVEQQLEAKPAAPRSNGNVQNGMFSTRFTGGPNLTAALKIYPYMDKQFQDKVKALVPAYVNVITRGGQDNPYGVPIGGATWAGNASVINNAHNCYRIWKYFPDLIDPEYVLAGLNFIFGCHPYSNVSFVEGVGVNTKKVAYNNNRADYSTIPGGIVPGLLVKEDFFENEEEY